MNRVEKKDLLAKFLQGLATPEQVCKLRESQEPIQVTLQLGYEDEEVCLEPDAPTYHIELYSDNSTKCYYRYPDGRVEYRNH